MKKYIIYIGILIIGLLLGWVLFGNNRSETTKHNHNKIVSNQMWTCSMHPQIMQKEPGDCPICGMELIPAKADANGLSIDEFKLTENAVKLANIQTIVIADNSNASSYISLSGKIVANEKKNAIQVSYFSGRIEKLFINFTGKIVKKGQLLATIYSPELLSAQQELLTTSKLKETQPHLYKAVRNKLKLWKFSDKQINAIETSGKIMENFPIYANLSGTVTEKMVEVGQSIKQGQALFKITNLKSLWAQFDVYENQVEALKIGQLLEISTNAFPDKKITTTVSFINPVLDTKTRTSTLRANINNNKRVLKPGMFVEGKIKITSKNSSILIPSSAILWTGKRSIVYVKTKLNEPVFEMREVEIGEKLGNRYQILSGLKSGEEIVMNGVFTIDAAAQLQGKKSMINQDNITHKPHLNTKINNKRVKVVTTFQNQLKAVFDAYIILKNALIEDNSKKANKAAVKILDKLESVDMKLLNGKAHNTWMQLSAEIKKHTQALLLATDIKTQRDHFNPLSDKLIIAIEKFGIHTTVYSQFCPMANNNKGAYWLSTENKVLNPYYGNAMLTCGEVTKIIK